MNTPPDPEFNTIPDEPERPDPTLFRWSPADHYDAAIEILSRNNGTDIQLVIAHALLGILRRLDQYTP